MSDGGEFASSAVPVDFEVGAVRVSTDKAPVVPARRLVGRVVGKVVTTKSILDGVAACADLFVRKGMAVEAARALRQARGGCCPVCDRPYKKTRVVNALADFEWFAPDCDCEETDEERRSMIGLVESRLGSAGVPPEYLGATFETWDYRADDRVNRSMKVVYQYAKDRDYRSTGLVLYGDVGTGKTRCAVSALRRIAADGLKVQFVKMAEIVGRFADRERGKVFADGLQSRDAVLFDDLDKIGTMGNEWVAEQVFRVFDGLLGAGHRILATSNLSDYPAFEKKFGAAVMSRLLGGCQFVEFRGDDYRALRAKREREQRDQARANAAKAGGGAVG